MKDARQRERDLARARRAGSNRQRAAPMERARRIGAMLVDYPPHEAARIVQRALEVADERRQLLHPTSRRERP